MLLHNGVSARGACGLLDRVRRYAAAMTDAGGRRELLSTRARLGLAAVALLVTAAFWDAEVGTPQAFQAALVRVGVLAAAAWFAWPQIVTTRWAPKTRAGRYVLGTMAALIMMRPWVFLPIALPLGILYLMKRPTRRTPK